MLKHAKRTKLSLHRETIRFLDDAKLDGAAGGFGLDTLAQCKIWQPTVPLSLCVSLRYHIC